MKRRQFIIFLVERRPRGWLAPRGGKATRRCFANFGRITA